MKTRLPAVFVAALLLAADAPRAGAEEAVPDVAEILKKFDELWRGTSSEAVITMRIRTRNWERSLTMRAWSLGTERSLVRILKPLKERGVATLKVGREVYNYLPDTDRTIKITSAMMMGSWMGSHFTNDDLVKESEMADDYDSKVSFAGERDGLEVVEVASIPKPGAAIVWGKVISVFRRRDLQPLSAVYYDEDGKAARTMTLSGHREMSGKLLPAVMRMVPADKPDEFTEIIYEDIKFGVGLDAAFFSLGQLRR